MISEIRRAKTSRFFSTDIRTAEDGRIYRPNETSLRLDEAMELQRLVRDHDSHNVLELGLALGASAVAIAEELELKSEPTRHTVLDPFQDHFRGLGLRELELHSLRGRVDFRPVLSEDSSFDLIFHDGSHSVGNKVTDAFFGDRCLREGGVFAFHDAFLHATVACVRYLVIERNYRVISLRPDSPWKRMIRAVRYAPIHGYWYARHVIPRTCRSLVALKKPQRPN